MFILSDLAVTTSENEGLRLTITPEASLETDYVIRYFITGAGIHPASSSSILLSTGSFDFASGTTAAQTATIGRTFNNLVKDYPKGLSVKIASYKVNEVGGVRTESEETVLLDDHHVTITDSSDTTIKPTHDLPYSADKDVVILGNSFDSRDISQGSGDDLLIITRHITKDHEIRDTEGQNIIKFDYGVVITSISQSVSILSNGYTRVNETRLKFDSGFFLQINSPSDKLYQIGDNALLSFDEFFNEIKKGGILPSSNFTLNRAYKITEQQESYAPFVTSSGAITVTGLAENVREAESLSLTLAPNGTLSSSTEVRWQITGVGRVPISASDITTTNGTLTFAANATSSDSQSLTIRFQDNQLVDYDRQFLLKIEVVDSTGQRESIVENYLVTIADDETASEGYFFQPATIYDDVIILGQSNRKEEVSGLGGDDIYVVTRHVVSDVQVFDLAGDNIIKFDEGVVITSVHEDKFQLGSYVSYTQLVLTLETGAELTIFGPRAYDYQIGDGLVREYQDFINTLTSGGFTSDGLDQPTTILTMPYSVTPDAATTGLTLSHSNITIFEGRQNAVKDLATITSTETGYSTAVSDDRFEVRASGGDYILRLKASHFEIV